MNQKSALLVEDDVTSARLYQSLLERQGFAVTVLADGSDAFMEAHNRPYDLLLLDLMLPNMDGLAILRRLRAQRRFAHTPIFLYTSNDLGQVEPLALEAGATKVFSKNLPARELVQAILDATAALQASHRTASQDPGEGDTRQQHDFRVPGQADSPKLSLRMAPTPPEPPKPKPPPPPPPVSVETNEEDKEPREGLLKRLFKPRSRDE